MAKNDNLTDLLTDVADAIRSKKGTSAKINPQNFASEIASIETGGDGGGVTINNQSKSVEITENGTTEVTADAGYTGLGKVTINTNVASSGGGTTPSRPSWTGHADVEGLKAIGWTDEDIAYYQENGVNWNAEDDEYHKVTDDNKALYGVLTANNISTYKDRIIYLPKIDTSGVTNMTNMFSACFSMVAIPLLDTKAATNMTYMFNSCYSLVSIPQLDTANVTKMGNMFYCCYSLVSIPQLDTANVTNMSNMLYECRSLVSIAQLNTANVTTMSRMFYKCGSLVSIPPLDTAKVTDMGNMFNGCYSLASIPQLDMQGATSVSSMFTSCYSLIYAYLGNIKKAVTFDSSSLLSKDSLLYLINNEASTSSISITLKAYAYDNWSVDADVVAALEAHPNVSLTSVS